MYPHTLPESPVRGDHSHTRGYTLAEAVLVPAGHRCPGSTRNMLGAGGECLWSICVLGSSSVIFWKQRVKMSYKPRSPYKPPSKKKHNYFLSLSWRLWFTKKQEKNAGFLSSIFFYQAYKPVNLFFRFFLLQKKRPQEEKAKQVYNSGYEVFGKKKGKKKREKKKLWRLRRCIMMRVYNSKKQNHFLDISFVNARFLDSVTNHDEKRSMFFRCMDLLRRE